MSICRDFSIAYAQWCRHLGIEHEVINHGSIFARLLHFQDALPFFNGRQLQLEELWTAVQHFGGSRRVSEGRLWATVGRRFDPPPTMTNFSYRIKQLYAEYLLEFERVCSFQKGRKLRMPRISAQSLDPLCAMLSPSDMTQCRRFHLRAGDEQDRLPDCLLSSRPAGSWYGSLVSSLPF